MEKKNENNLELVKQCVKRRGRYRIKQSKSDSKKIFNVIYDMLVECIRLNDNKYFRKYGSLFKLTAYSDEKIILSACSCNGYRLKCIRGIKETKNIEQIINEVNEALKFYGLVAKNIKKNYKHFSNSTWEYEIFYDEQLARLYST